jgi:hypothetical protein
VGYTPQYALHPFDEATLLEHLELARFAETPLKISETLASYGTSARYIVRDLLQGNQRDPALLGWCEELKRLSPVFASSNSYDRQQLRIFAKNLAHPSRLMRFPAFTV